MGRSLVVALAAIVVIFAALSGALVDSPAVSPLPKELPRTGLKERSRAQAAEAFAAGDVLRRRGNLGGAREAYLAAFQHWNDAEETRGMADAQTRLGELAAERGDPHGAHGAFLEAVELYGRLKDPERIRRLIELGRVCYRTDPHAAEVAYSQALQLAQGRGDRGLQGSALNSLGVLYARAEPRKALEAYDQALEIWKSLDNRTQQAATLHNLGTAYTVLGRLPEALERLGRALRLRQAVDDLGGEAATLTAIAWVHTLEGRFPEALHLYDEAILLRQTAGDRRGEAVTLDRRGTALARMGRYLEAEASYRRALEVRRDDGMPGSEAPVLANLGWLFLASGDPRRGERLLQEALPLLRRSADRHGEAHTLLGLAQAARQRGDLSRALDRVEEAIALVESLRREAPGLELRVSYGAQRYGYYEIWIDLLMELHKSDPEAGFDARALEASERGRGRGLVESLSQEIAAADAGPSQEIHAVEARIQKLERVRFQLRELGRDVPPEFFDDIDQRLGALLLERDRLRAAPLTGGPDALRPALRELRDLLGTETLLLEYAVGEERSFLWLLGTDGLVTQVLPGRAALAAQTRRAHELLSRRLRRTSRGMVQKAAAALGQTLLGPVADRLADKRLLIVPDGPLHDVPFAALPVRPDGPPLLVEHEIVLAPSASALLLLRREQTRRPPAAGALALVADPVFGAEDPRLRSGAASAPPARLILRGGHERRLPRLLHSRREAEAILRFLPSSAKRVAALDFAADRGAVLEGLLAEYRIVHFATHAVLDPEQPEQSSLVLSLVDAGGRPRDGFLRAYEIRDLELSADLVVLSACSTGVGRELRGEGPLGLSRAFLDAGASRVVVSLWDVEDKPTAELMSRFYQGHLAAGLSPAQALRQAQLSLWRDPHWSAPYYWSGFVLEGDWR